MDIWTKIRADYIRGGISQHDLADKYGLSYTVIKDRCRKEGWVAQRAEKRRKTAEKIVDQAADREAKQAERLWTAADRLLERVMKAADVACTPRDIRDLTGAVKDIKEILSIKGQRDIREQEARIEKLTHDAKERDTTVPEIRIVMDGAAEEYAK